MTANKNQHLDIANTMKLNRTKGGGSGEQDKDYMGLMQRGSEEGKKEESKTAMEKYWHQGR